MLADGIVKLMRAWEVGREMGQGPGIRAVPRLQIKGEATIDWSDKRARTALLAGIVTRTGSWNYRGCPGGVARGRC